MDITPIKFSAWVKWKSVVKFRDLYFSPDGYFHRVPAHPSALYMSTHAQHICNRKLRLPYIFHAWQINYSPFWVLYVFFQPGLHTRCPQVLVCMTYTLDAMETTSPMCSSPRDYGMACAWSYRTCAEVIWWICWYMHYISLYHWACVPV